MSLSTSNSTESLRNKFMSASMTDSITSSSPDDEFGKRSTYISNKLPESKQPILRTSSKKKKRVSYPSNISEIDLTGGLSRCPRVS
jgi:hypothetical protein